MLDKAPIIKVPQPKNKRIRWLEPHEAQRLIDECPEPLKSVVEFALATGLRRSNIINLEWQQIDMQRRVAWINPEESKSNRAIGVALNDTACRVLKNKSVIITVGYLCTRKAVPNQTERKRQQ